MHGIIHEVTLLYATQSNGIAERKNCILLDMVNCILNKVPYKFFGKSLISYGEKEN